MQLYRETDFSARIFSYFYRVYDKDGPHLTALAIYTGSERQPPDTFRYELFGTEVIYRFNAFSVRQANEKELLASDNPFALVILAAKYHIKAHKDIQKRYSFKRKLVTLALGRKYERPTIIALLRFVHLIISLPETLEIQFEQELVKQLRNNDAMELTQSQKRIAHTVYEAVYGQSLEERDLQQQVVEKTAIARRLLSFGVLNPEQVAEATGLSVSNVQSIQQDLDNK